MAAKMLVLVKSPCWHAQEDMCGSMLHARGGHRHPLCAGVGDNVCLVISDMSALLIVQHLVHTYIVETLLKVRAEFRPFSNEDTAYCLSYIEMCTKLPLKCAHLSNEDSAYCSSYIEMRGNLPI